MTVTLVVPTFLRQFIPAINTCLDMSLILHESPNNKEIVIDSISQKIKFILTQQCTKLSNLLRDSGDFLHRQQNKFGLNGEISGKSVLKQLLSVGR